MPVDPDGPPAVLECDGRRTFEETVWTLTPTADRVGFRYGHEPVLHDVSLRVEPGETAVHAVVRVVAVVALVFGFPAALIAARSRSGVMGSSVTRTATRSPRTLARTSLRSAARTAVASTSTSSTTAATSPGSSASGSDSPGGGATSAGSSTGDG